MAFCNNCGKELTQGAKFCAECGAPVDSSTEQRPTKREQEYAGKIVKCPKCGETLDAFVLNCPSCGQEIRGDVNSAAIREFAAKLEKETSPQKKITTIRSFPIPNTKEDIFEFLILASSNVSGDLDDSISDAWRSKVEQAYQKAKLAFKGRDEFEHIQDIYNQMMAKLVKDKKIKNVKKAGALISELMPVLPNVVIIFAWLLSIFILIPLCGVGVDNVGVNGYLLIILIDLIVGTFLMPHAFRCDSSLPKLILTMGLTFSIAVLVTLLDKNVDEVGVSSYHLILIVDIICSVVIFIRMLKHKVASEDKKGAVNGVSFAIALVCLAVFFVVYIIGSIFASFRSAGENAAIEEAEQEEESVTYDWPETGISQILPKPPTQYGKIYSDDEENFNIDVYQVTADQYKEYVTACEDKGFNISSSKLDGTYDAWNEEEYELKIIYLEDDEEMDVFLDAPLEIAEIKWPDSKLVKQIPQPKSLMGNIQTDDSDQFIVYIANMTPDDYAAYVDECMEKSFDIDYSRKDTTFTAKNKAGYELRVDQELFDKIRISICDESNSNE